MEIKKFGMNKPQSFNPWFVHFFIFPFQSIEMRRVLLALTLFASCAAPSQNTISIVPAPLKMETKQGNFTLSSTTVIYIFNKGEQATADFLNSYLKEHHGFSLQVVNKEPSKNFISFVTPQFFKKPDNEERYTLNVTENSVQIQGDGKAGTFYGMQTLIQLLPIPTSDKLALKAPKFSIPCVSIDDQPRFAYRGMHLDVSRHFFPIDYVKKYIDYIALHKMNRFHWHLTDDQGWRIEIKKYPKLTSVGAWRKGTIIGRFPGTGNDNTKHGGFYTQEEVKEIVQYAAARQITVIPEIEMPGHSMAAIAAYPQLSTTPDVQQEVAMTWGLNGVANNVLAPTDYVFNFIQDVLSEVMPLFPSEVIHIGGDECSKIWWKKDPVSQEVMKKNNLKNEDELQSYFIQRIEKFVNSKGKKIIGWDEILEGGLAPNALVMSWTGEKGGIHAAKEKHQVVMTPGGWCYFDHSQSKNEDSVTFGQYLPLEKVYNYEPVPKELNEEEAKYILGAQANLWTEYVAYPSKVEYQIFPRMAALSEVLWSSKQNRNWEDFEKRLPVQLKRYELWKANYSKAYYDVNVTIEPNQDNDGVLLTGTVRDSSIWVGIGKRKDWSEKDEKKLAAYGSGKAQLSIQEQWPYTVFALKNGKMISSVTIPFAFNKATGKKIATNIPPSQSYPGNGGIFSMVNGVKSEKGIQSSEWCGWAGKQVEIVIDLGKETNIKEVNLHILAQPSSWIHAPESFKVELSNDGATFEDPHTTFLDFDQYAEGYSSMKWMKRKLSEDPNKTYTTRFIKLKVNAVNNIPSGNPGAGKPAWMFIDEIEVN
jgi:hexosaminidase